MLRPASRATSTNSTGEVDDGEAEGVRSRGRFHLQSGVVSASISELPRTTREEPRKWRRARLIASDFDLGRVYPLRAFRATPVYTDRRVAVCVWRPVA